VCVALFVFGLYSFKSKSSKTLVLIRNTEGKGASILSANGLSPKKAEYTNSGINSTLEMPLPKKHGKTKNVFGPAFVIALVSSYALTALMMGTYSPFLVVSSQSMQPALNYGDLVIMRGEHPENIGVGDIIAFNVPSPYDRLAASPTVHRVVEKWTEDGGVYFKTRGDQNNNADAWTVSSENVISKYTQYKIPYIGFVFILLATPLGLALLASTIALAFVYDHFKKKENVKYDSRKFRKNKS
jgi:signal peptidase I